VTPLILWFEDDSVWVRRRDFDPLDSMQCAKSFSLDALIAETVVNDDDDNLLRVVNALRYAADRIEVARLEKELR